jgi:hypothetical protein
MSWIVIDLETSDAPVEAIEAAMTAWKPPGNCTKPETIEAKRQEAAIRYQEQAALLDASPIICMSAITSTGQHLIFNQFPITQPIDGWDRIPAASEQVMLLGIRHWLNSWADDTTIAGHNIRYFDLPKLRQAYIRHRLRLPEILRPRLDDDPPLQTVDTMHLIRAFSMELRDERYISLNQVAYVLGIDRPKKLLNGASVPALYREGYYQEILTYSCIDVATTARAFALMTGQAPDLS